MTYLILGDYQDLHRIQYQYGALLKSVRRLSIEILYISSLLYLNTMGPLNGYSMQDAKFIWSTSLEDQVFKSFTGKMGEDK